MHWCTTALIAVLPGALLAAGCGCDDTRPPLPTLDVSTDPDADAVPDPVVDAPDADTVHDTTPLDTAGDADADADAELPPSCPPAGALGGGCGLDGDCPAGTCLVQSEQVYEGETYRTWTGGYCVDATYASGCDPLDASGCPAGARCVHLGVVGCEDRWACMDACSYADDTGTPYPYNACCRPGYRCDPLFEVCLPGCSGDRECCEVWNDSDGDGEREAGEVTLDASCLSTCSAETWTCTGASTGTWTSPCALDAACPAGGTCIAQACPSVLGGPFPGGMCAGFGCASDVAGCVGSGGGCVRVTAAGIVGPVCLAACSTGLAPGDDASPCRAGFACVPVCDPGWVGAIPTGGEDGHCWPAEGVDSGDMYGACESDADCPSTLGLARCIAGSGVSYCSSACNPTLAAHHDVCGPAAAEGEPPAGVCFDCACRRACGEPGAALTDDPCGVGMALACYPAEALFGELAWSAGAVEPAGVCLPACVTTGDCQSLWGIPHECDPSTGLCAL